MIMCVQALIENEKGIKLKGLEFTETKLAVSQAQNLLETLTVRQPIKLEMETDLTDGSGFPV